MTAPRKAALLGVDTLAGSSKGLPKVQPATAAETAGVPIKSTNGSNPRAWKITGVHQRIAKAVPAAQNPVAADVRGHLLNSVATRCMILQAWCRISAFLTVSSHQVPKSSELWRFSPQETSCLPSGATYSQLSLLR
jgi:hypothetical protein